MKTSVQADSLADVASAHDVATARCDDKATKQSMTGSYRMLRHCMNLQGLDTATYL